MFFVPQQRSDQFGLRFDCVYQLLIHISGASCSFLNTSLHTYLFPWLLQWSPSGITKSEVDFRGMESSWQPVFATSIGLAESVKRSICISRSCSSYAQCSIFCSNINSISLGGERPYAQKHPTVPCCLCFTRQCGTAGEATSE